MEPKEIAQQLCDRSLDFLKKSKNRINANTYIYSDRDIAKMYIRKSRRYIDKSIVIFFDVASIDVKENMQKKGIVSTYLDLIEKVIPYPILLKNAINEALFNHMTKRRDWELRDINSFIYRKGKPWIISTRSFL